MMSDRGTRNGSGEKKSRLTKSIVIKLPVNQGFQITEVNLEIVSRSLLEA